MLPRLLKQMKKLLMQLPREQPSPVMPPLEQPSLEQPSLVQPLEFCSQQQETQQKQMALSLEHPSPRLKMRMTGRATYELMKLNLQN
jgi:hypothetical protein